MDLGKNTGTKTTDKRYTYILRITEDNGIIIETNVGAEGYMLLRKEQLKWQSNTSQQ